MTRRVTYDNVKPIHISEFREKYSDFIPTCKTRLCKKQCHYMGTYSKGTGYPIFRKYCSMHHSRRIKNYKKKIQKLDNRTRPTCEYKACRQKATLLGSDIGGKLKYSVCCKDHHFKKPYLMYRKDYCENIDGRLGFKCTTTIIDYKWQNHVDHIDEVHTNDDPDNLQTLCGCCHAVKTKYFREKNVEALQLMLETIYKSEEKVIQILESYLNKKQ